MTSKPKDLAELIDEGVKAGIAEAIEGHRLAGHSIAVLREGKVVIIPPEEIRPLSTKADSAKE